MDNKRPMGHEKNVTGSASVNKRGSGLGTGPVGTTGGRKNSTGGSRPQGSGSTITRAGIPSVGLIVIVLIFSLLKGNLFGGSTGIDTSSLGNAGSVYDTSSSSFTSTSSTSSAKLDTSVADGSRAKRTTILGNGKDTVTIMVYLCGTDLESRSGMATSDLSEMANATLKDNVNLIVYTGGCKAWKNSIVSSSVNQIYQVKDGGLICLEKDMGSAAMTKPETLTEFINYCKKNFPANRNELIFWDHGGGSISGYGYDEKNSGAGSMNLAGIDKALKNANMTFDFIGFDACLMATLETALTIEPYADYLIASEETEPGVGWYYTNWLTELSANTSKPTIEVGKRIVDDFVDVCASKCVGQKTTLSVVDLAELKETVPAELTDFAKSTNELIQSNQYQIVATARNNTREFATSSKIDQVDLVDLAENIGTTEAKKLAEAIKGAVKYNRFSTSMSDANGIAIYFPYQKASKVSNAAAVYNQIGMDNEYTRCIKEFASLEVCGQQTTGSSGNTSVNPLSILMGGSSLSSNSAGGSADMISGILGTLAGNTDLVSGIGSLLSGRSMSDEQTAQYLADNYFDPTALTWITEGGDKKIKLSESQWNMVVGLDLNVFVDDGNGYIDLGLDNVMDYDDAGNLLGNYDGSWMTLNGQVVAFYHNYSSGDESDYTISGYVPAMLNGERVEIIITFDTKHPGGYVAGAQRVYVKGETENIAKSMIALADGDKIDFICDYYKYDGTYEDSFYLGEQMTVNGDITVSYAYLTDVQTEASYRFTDIYQQHYWTPVFNK